MKKLIAIVLSAVMLMSVLSVGISAGTTVNPYEIGARNAIIKFFDTDTKLIVPVEIQVVKFPAKFDGKIAVCYADDELLESFNGLQFTTKYNMVYDVKETSEDSYGSGKVIYMNTAEDETLGYNKVIFIEIPEGYVVYPAQDLVIVDDVSSWKISYDVITEEAYAAILAAEAEAVEETVPAAEVVEETAEAVEEVAEAVEETEEAAEETVEEVEETAEDVVEIDLDAIAAVIKEVLGEDFDLDGYLREFSDEEGLLTVPDFLLAYSLLINGDLLTEETVAVLTAAIEEALGEEVSLVFAELVEMFLAAVLESLTAEEAPEDATEEAPAVEEAPAA